MKKTILATLLITLVGLISCSKTKENEWSRFYGYTKADLIGHYEANPDDDAYPELPTEGVQVYRNVTIDIIDDGENSNLVRLHIVIPNIINKNFSGAILSNESESDLAFHNNNEDILMTVYKNKQNVVRLNGRERRCTYNSNNELIDCVVHNFDVVATSNSSNSK